jgi:hypothetical protein
MRWSVPRLIEPCRASTRRGRKIAERKGPWWQRWADSSKPTGFAIRWADQHYIKKPGGKKRRQRKCSTMWE